MSFSSQKTIESITNQCNQECVYFGILTPGSMPMDDTIEFFHIPFSGFSSRLTSLLHWVHQILYGEHKKRNYSFTVLMFYS